MAKKIEKPNLIWEKIETQWSVPRCIEKISFDAIEEKMGIFLLKNQIYPQALSHFGFVVKSIEQSIKILKKYNLKYSSKLIKDWVKSYRVYVGRIIFYDKELEFIEPKGESFFNKFLEEEGESLHHLAFIVNNIEVCLKKLKAHGVELIDKEPRSGSHGKVIFLMPRLFGNMCIELCQLM